MHLPPRSLPHGVHHGFDLALGKFAPATLAPELPAPASQNAPSPAERASRSENQLRGCAFSTAYVLPNASGLAWRAASRMPRLGPHRLVSLPLAIIICPLQWRIWPRDRQRRGAARVKLRSALPERPHLSCRFAKVVRHVPEPQATYPLPAYRVAPGAAPTQQG